jgi:hypothetical protein
MKRSLLVSSACLVVLLSTGPAFAQALLQSAAPPTGTPVAPASEIRIACFRGVEPRCSGVALSDPGGAVLVSQS